MNPTIEILEVSKWYGEVVGLNGISAQIGPGVTGLLGPNGAGKTTLFRLLNGLAVPSLGLIRILGEQVTYNSALFRNIGFCPEMDAFYEDMTGFQFLKTLGRVHGLSSSEAETAANAALDRVELREVGHKKLSSMSKGMRQRIKLGQALLHDPKILFLDEPLNGMDPVLRHRTVQQIRELGEEGKTVVVSSHILHEVEMMTNNILLLIHGKVLAQGDIREIRNLLDQVPRKIVIRTPDARKIASSLMTVDKVVGLRMDGERQLSIETLNTEPVAQRLTEGASRKEFVIDEVFSSDEDLESVFKLLVG